MDHAGDEQPSEEHVQATAHGVGVIPSASFDKTQRLEGQCGWQVGALAVLDALLATPEAAIFARPVSELFPELMDYACVVAKPMDLGSIHELVTNGTGYHSLHAFLADVELVFANSRLYNTRARSRVHHLTNACDDLFKAVFSQHFPAELLFAEPPRRCTGADGRKRRRLEGPVKNVEQPHLLHKARSRKVVFSQHVSHSEPTADLLQQTTSVLERPSPTQEEMKECRAGTPRQPPPRPQQPVLPVEEDTQRFLKELEDCAGPWLPGLPTFKEDMRLHDFAAGAVEDELVREVAMVPSTPTQKAQRRRLRELQLTAWRKHELQTSREERQQRRRMATDQDSNFKDLRLSRVTWATINTCHVYETEI